MGWFDNPDSPETRRKNEQERRQKAAERDRQIAKERAAEEKLRQAKEKAINEERRREDEKAINEMAEKFGKKDDKNQHAGSGKTNFGLNRGPGSFGSTGYKAPQADSEWKIPGPVGFNPNAAREGHDDDAPSKGGKGGAKGGAGGSTPLRRPF